MEIVIEMRKGTTIEWRKAKTSQAKLNYRNDTYIQIIHIPSCCLIDD